jgi:hypothetical protein
MPKPTTPKPPPKHPFLSPPCQTTTAPRAAALHSALPARREGLYSHWRGRSQELFREFVVVNSNNQKTPPRLSLS